MELELLTDRLLRRPLAIDDLDLVSEMFMDPEVVRYLGDAKTATEIAAPVRTRRLLRDFLWLSRWFIRRPRSGDSGATKERCASVSIAFDS